VNDSTNTSIELLIAHWAERLVESEQRYSTNRTKETRAEYLRVLKIFSRLVIDNQIPEEPS
jgi:hypothetical protein